MSNARNQHNNSNVVSLADYRRRRRLSSIKPRPPTKPAAARATMLAKIIFDDAIGRFKSDLERKAS